MTRANTDVYNALQRTMFIIGDAARIIDTCTEQESNHGVTVVAKIRYPDYSGFSGFRHGHHIAQRALKRTAADIIKFAFYSGFCYCLLV